MKYLCSRKVAAEANRKLKLERADMDRRECEMAAKVAKVNKQEQGHGGYVVVVEIYIYIYRYRYR
jgi:hypothetical protein